MSKDKLTDYDSSTASNNTDVGGISVAEGMLPSAVNNSLRELTKQLGAFADGTDGIDVLSLADDDASHAIKLQAPSAVTANTTFTLPDGDGTADQVLKTDGSGQLGFADRHSNPSLIINGAMNVAQRGTSAVAAGAGTYPSIDRIKCYESTDGAFTLEQSTTVPSGQGFSNSAKFVVTTADTSLAAGQYAQATQVIEAQNLQHLNYGTSGAKALTLSFWCRSSKTGTYCITIVKEDSTATQYVKEFSVSGADTWEKKTITIEPDSNITAASGAIANDNGAGLYVYWNFAQGSTYTGATDDTWSTNTNHFATTNQVNWMDSTSNNFYLTGVKLEVGSTATDFQHRSYGDELARCQRYFTTWNAGWNGVSAGAGYQQSSLVSFGIKMNHTPDLARTGGTSSTRYPSSNFFTLYGNADGFVANVTATSAGGNEAWQATGTADAEL